MHARPLRPVAVRKGTGGDVIDQKTCKRCVHYYSLTGVSGQDGRGCCELHTMAGPQKAVNFVHCTDDDTCSAWEGHEPAEVETNGQTKRNARYSAV